MVNSNGVEFNSGDEVKYLNQLFIILDSKDGLILHPTLGNNITQDFNLEDVIEDIVKCN